MLSSKNRYLQIALNNTLEDAQQIIKVLPASDRIILEAGTPMIKQYGVHAIQSIKSFWTFSHPFISPFVVADMKTMDRGATEVHLVADAGGDAIIALGEAPVETINVFISTCRERKLTSMLDMMNVEQPTKVLRQLKKLPDVVLLHRGVDEETFNKNKPIPYLQINKIRATYDVLISVAGGDTAREVQRAIFNDANIVVVWKEFYSKQQTTEELAHTFLREIK